MPKGIYQRKPRQPGLKRNVGEESRAVFRANMALARAAAKNSSKAVAAKVKNAGKACSVRTARMILRKLPLGAEAGNAIKLSRNRTLELLDRFPIQQIETTAAGETRVFWEQKFRQSGQMKVYGIVHEFRGICRIVWGYEPNMENLMEMPMFEELGKD